MLANHSVSRAVHSGSSSLKKQLAHPSSAQRCRAEDASSTPLEPRKSSASISAENNTATSNEYRYPRAAALPPHWPSQPYVGRFTGSDNQQVLLGNWPGAFNLHEVKTGPLKGRMVFKERPYFDCWVPKNVDAIPFAGPSKDLLVRLAGSESLWAIMQ